MSTILLVVHVLVAAALIGMVLLQHGKGADAGAAFGSGASATVFGAQGSASFLSRTTAVLAAVFFITSLTLAYLSGQGIEKKSVLDEIDTTQSVTVPAGPSAGDKLDVPSVPSPAKQ